MSIWERNAAKRDSQADGAAAADGGGRGVGRRRERWSRSEAEARMERGEPVDGSGEDGAGPAGLTARSRALLFARSTGLDFLLVLLVSACLVLTVSFAFESAPEIRGNVGVVASGCALMLVPLFAGSWSKRAVLPAAVAAAVVAVGIVAFAAASMPAGTPLFADGRINDVPENYVVFACVLVAVPALAYLLSRRTVGLAFLLALTIVSCGAVEFLYRDWMAANDGLPITLAAYAGVGVLFVYQTYRRSVYSAQRAKRTTFLGAFAFGALIMGVCMGLAVAVFAGVIAPLNLPTVEIRPFQEYYQRPVVEYTGVFDRQQVESQDDTTDDTNDDMEQTNQDAEGNDDQDAEIGQSSQGPLSGVAQMLQAFDPNSWSQDFSTVSFERLRLGAIAAALLAIALAVAAVVARRSVRERRLRRITDRSRAQQARYLYEFLVDRFARLKIRKAASLTPMEFALGSQRAMQPFSHDTGGVDFVRVTDVYQRACYGGQEMTDEEYGDLLRYYRAFFKNARRYVGKLRWIWKFWRI